VESLLFWQPSCSVILNDGGQRLTELGSRANPSGADRTTTIAAKRSAKVLMMLFIACDHLYTLEKQSALNVVLKRGQLELVLSSTRSRRRSTRSRRRSRLSMASRQARKVAVHSRGTAIAPAAPAVQAKERIEWSFQCSNSSPAATTKAGEHSGWIADYFSPGPDGKRKRHTRTFTTRKEADAWLARTVVEVQQGIHTPASASITVLEAGELWIAQAPVSSTG
jgi:hypothetical protein